MKLSIHGNLDNLFIKMALYKFTLKQLLKFICKYQEKEQLRIEIVLRKTLIIVWHDDVLKKGTGF